MRADFYLLENEQPSKWHVACRLLEKAYLKRHSVFVFCDNQKDAEHLDELLWTFKEDSFIPHNLMGEGPIPPPPIQIGYSTEPRGFDDILLNMAADIPAFAGKFKRIMEIIAPDTASKELGRAHYKAYRNQQVELFTHQLALQQ